MKKVALTLEQKYKATLEDEAPNLEKELKKHRIRKYNVAKLAHISPQAVANQFSKKKLTHEVYVAANMLIAESNEKQGGEKGE